MSKVVKLVSNNKQKQNPQDQHTFYISAKQHWSNMSIYSGNMNVLILSNNKPYGDVIQNYLKNKKNLKCDLMVTTTMDQCDSKLGIKFSQYDAILVDAMWYRYIFFFFSLNFFIFSNDIDDNIGTCLAFASDTGTGILLCSLTSVTDGKRYMGKFMLIIQLLFTHNFCCFYNQ